MLFTLVMNYHTLSNLRTFSKVNVHFSSQNTFPMLFINNFFKHMKAIGMPTFTKNKIKFIIMTYFFQIYATCCFLKIVEVICFCFLLTFNFNVTNNLSFLALISQKFCKIVLPFYFCPAN